MRNGLYFLLFLIITSCQNKKKIPISDASFSLRITDSIVVDMPDAKFADFRANKLLLYNSSSFDILTKNILTNSSKKFNNFGEEKEGYNRLIKGNVSFKNDSVITVSTNKSLINYDTKGNFISKLHIENTSEITPIKNFKFINDSIVFYVSIPEGNTSKISYYKNKRDVLIKENVKTNERVSFVSFPNEKSDIYTEDYFYPYIYDHYFNIDNNFISYLNSNGNKIYYYDMNDGFKEKKSLDLDLEFYNRIQINFGTLIDRDESIAQAFCSGIIKGNFHHSDSIFTIYKEGFSRDFIKKFAQDNVGFPYYVRPKSKYYLNVIYNGIKIMNDVKFDEAYGVPVYVENKGFILSKKYITEEEDLKGITVFYILKMIKND